MGRGEGTVVGRGGGGFVGEGALRALPKVSIVCNPSGNVSGEWEVWGEEGGGCKFTIGAAILVISCKFISSKLLKGSKMLVLQVNIAAFDLENNHVRP